MTNTTRRVFDAEFKRKAVELYINSDKTGQEVAGDLGISPEALYKWNADIWLLLMIVFQVLGMNSQALQQKKKFAG